MICYTNYTIHDAQPADLLISGYPAILDDLCIRIRIPSDKDPDDPVFLQTVPDAVRGLQKAILLHMSSMKVLILRFPDTD